MNFPYMIRVPGLTKKPMRTNFSELLCVLGITILVWAACIRLFIPQIALIVTPDFGRSDGWHFSYPTKYALWESLQHGTLPLWRSDVGDGFPLFAEGQTGALFFLNLIYFSLFRPEVAYNLALVSSIWIFALGTYASARLLGISRGSAFFGSLVLSFSALPVLQLTHITLLQGMSIMPILFASTILLYQKQSLATIAFMAIIVSQQIFAGFPQAVFLTAILTMTYALWQTVRTHRYRPFLACCAAWFLGFIGASAQIIPSYEFLRQSTNPGGFGFSSATQYSMPLRHILTFFHPYALGNPKSGTYPPFFQFDGSIFWENTAYVGILPIVGMVIAWIKTRRLSHVQFFTAIFFTSLLFAWGKHSPIYLVFGMWPLSLFRVPSRFLWLSALSLVFLAMFGADTLLARKHKMQMKIVLLVAGLVTLAELASHWYSYHLILPYEQLTDVQKTKLADSQKMYTIAMAKAHNEIFLTSGWTRPERYVLLYKESYAPLSNILYGKAQHDVYAGRFLYRPQLADSVLQQLIPIREHEATVSSSVMLNLFGIDTIRSYIPLHTDELILKQTEKTGDVTRYDYKNPHAVPRAYIIRSASAAASLNEALPILTGTTFVPGTTALLETRDVVTNPALAQFIRPIESYSSGTATIVSASHTNVTIRTQVSGRQPALLVLTDTYYAGWNATVDNTPSHIYPANLKQRAVIVPAGNHTVSFDYQPDSLQIGGKISIIVYLLMGALVARHFASQAVGTVQNTFRRDYNHPHNHTK